MSDAHYIPSAENQAYAQNQTQDPQYAKIQYAETKQHIKHQRTTRNWAIGITVFVVVIVAIGVTIGLIEKKTKSKNNPSDLFTFIKDIDINYTTIKSSAGGETLVIYGDTGASLYRNTGSDYTKIGEDIVPSDGDTIKDVIIGYTGNYFVSLLSSGNFNNPLETHTQYIDIFEFDNGAFTKIATGLKTSTDGLVSLGRSVMPVDQADKAFYLGMVRQNGNFWNSILQRVSYSNSTITASDVLTVNEQESSTNSIKYVNKVWRLSSGYAAHYFSEASTQWVTFWNDSKSQNGQVGTSSSGATSKVGNEWDDVRLSESLLGGSLVVATGEDGITQHNAKARFRGFSYVARGEPGKPFSIMVSKEPLDGNGFTIVDIPMFTPDGTHVIVSKNSEASILVFDATDETKFWENPKSVLKGFGNSISKTSGFGKHMTVSNRVGEHEHFFLFASQNISSSVGVVQYNEK